MAFKKTNLEDIDLGETNLENYFIKTYMNSASEVQLKVYILGLYFSEKKDKRYSIFTIAEELNIKAVEVLKAFEYWESKGLISIRRRQDENADIKYEFTYNGSKNLLFQSLLGETKTPNRTKQIETNSHNSLNEKTITILRNKECIDFFNDLELMISSPISQRDREKIAMIISSYASSHEMIKEAFKITYIDKNIRDINAIKYIESILINWSREGINTKQELIDNFKIKKELINALGINANHIKTSALSNFLIKWRPKIESDSLLLAIASYSAKKSNTSTIDRFEKLLEKISTSYPLTSEGFKSYIENDTKLNRGKRTKSNADKHHFNKDYSAQSKTETDFLLNRSKIMSRRENE